MKMKKKLAAFLLTSFTLIIISSPVIIQLLDHHGGM